MITINKMPITAENFAFDGCHKIYLIGNDEEKEKALEIGYNILPIAAIKRAWYDSCGLRFIQDWSNFKPIVKQGQKAIFK